MTTMAAGRRQVVAGNGYHLCIRSLQPDIKVEVALRVWDIAPDPPAKAEGHVPVSIESETGVLVVNQLEYGPAGEMTLPRPSVGEPAGDGRLLRNDARPPHRRHLRRPSHPGVEHPPPVTERYVLDLAYIREPEPVDDDDL
ncbi:hypothetical protein [Streptomyces sp. AGS-58]|uniref:hypothetical protein n=1 Tax=unclassified Streptomyces TaxID=2593676 RepID=UPI0035A2A9BF